MTAVATPHRRRQKIDEPGHSRPRNRLRRTSHSSFAGKLPVAPSPLPGRPELEQRITTPRRRPVIPVTRLAWATAAGSGARVRRQDRSIERAGLTREDRAWEAYPT